MGLLRILLKVVLGLAILVIVVELAFTGLFFAGITADRPQLQTRFEQDWALDPTSEIVLQDGVPQRTAGDLMWVCRMCGFSGPSNVTRFDDRGMRLDGFNGPARCKVAVFGDGFTVAIEVDNETVFTSLAERQLREDGFDINLMNFGLNNAGTTAQYLRYRQLIERGLEFDHVIVVFNTRHNVWHNSPKLNWWEYGHGYPYLVLRNGELVRQDGAGPAFERPLTWSLRQFLAEYSHIANLSARAYRGLRSFLSSGEQRDREDFGTPLPPDWEEAWQVTERVLALWASTVRDEGSSLSALIVDGWDTVEPTPRSDYRRQRVTKILDNQGVDSVDLFSIALAYLEEHAVGPPYLGLDQAGHYGPLGHRLMAEAIVPILKDNLTDCLN